MIRGVCIRGGSASRGDLHPGVVCLWGGRSASGVGGLHRGGLHSGEVGRTPPPPEIHGMLRDTVNKWVVRILLECILLYSIGSFISTDGHVSHDIDLECVLKI